MLSGILASLRNESAKTPNPATTEIIPLNATHSRHRHPQQRGSASLLHTDFHRFAHNDANQDLEAKLFYEIDHHHQEMQETDEVEAAQKAYHVLHLQ